MKNDDLTLLFRSFDEELGEIEHARLDVLLEQSAEAQAEHALIGRMREAVTSNAAASFDPHFADRVLQHVSSLHTQPARRPSDLQRRFDRVLQLVQSWRFATGMAAATAVAVALAVVTWLVPVNVSVPNGEARTVTLGDGSEVELSGGSSISYLRFWGRSERHVSLEGEAFFDVVEDPSPFVVETFNANVTVLGTEFNVRAWRDDSEPRTEVAVASGRVSVESHVESTTAARREGSAQAYSEERVQGGPALRDGAAVLDGPAVLEPGQAAVVSADSVVALRSASLDRVLAWRSGGLAFVDQPLGSVFKTLERRFGVEVEAAAPEISQRLLTYLNPQPQSPAAVLADICHTLNLRYRRTADGFEVLTTPDE